MAHKKGQGSSRNGRDSHSKRLGTKVGDGQQVTGGTMATDSRSRAGPFWSASAVPISSPETTSKGAATTPSSRPRRAR